MKSLFNVILLSFVLFSFACSSGEESKALIKPSPSKEAQAWVPGWRAASPLIVPRAGAAVVEANGYIYMIAGIDGKSVLKSTEYAKIQEDGSLGPWIAGSELNEERGFLEATVYNGAIYVVGGANAPDTKSSYAPNLLATVERAIIKPDGSLSAWVVEANSMNVPRRCNKVVQWNNHIYSVGGYGGVMLDSIDRAALLADGSVGKWSIDKEKMLVPHYVNGVKVKKGALYAIAGHDAKKGEGIKDVEWSKILDSGALSPWMRTSPLQVGRYGLATAYHGGNFYVLGGFTGKEFLESIEMAKIKENGELSAWKFTTPLASIRLSFSAIVYKDWVYVIGGGVNSKNSIKTVEYAAFNDAGDIGFWGTKAEEAEYKKKEAEKEEVGKKSKEKILEFEGVVIEVVQAESYTYIKVSGDKGEGWLAAPKVEAGFVPGSKIQFSEGILMRDFYSKALDRTFPGIFFVGEAQAIE